ncbi:hypothetical protein AVEN_196344-1 [Araneus ventricosus]|uniref:Uncharacterized protein n=1 Tax=Araneus ventricosus TaxID=182803 RepID=A0A4Y2AUI1_ARAVE|nr:hypothetical protein AVEN_196344-1 [Araneus ventricosus]
MDPSASFPLFSSLRVVGDTNGRPPISSLRVPFNTLTPNPAVTGHATSILVGRIWVGCCSEREEKTMGRVVIKGTLRGEIRDERPAVHISHHP